MRGKQKTFDCVEMKRRAQRTLREEYEARQREFVSYCDFLEAKANESELAKVVRAKITRAGARRA